MMKRPIYILLILTTVVMVSSCRSYKYNSTKMSGVDFSQFKTYGWLLPADSLSKNYFSNDIARHNIMSTADNQIQNLGLTYSKDNPDVVFRYTTIVNNKRRMVWSGGWGWGGGMQPVGEEDYRYAHLIFEAIDRSTNTVVWQARGSGEVRNPEKAIDRLSKVVDGIFNKYPNRR